MILDFVMPVRNWKIQRIQLLRFVWTADLKVSGHLTGYLRSGTGCHQVYIGKRSRNRARRFYIDFTKPTRDNDRWIRIADV